MNNLLLIILFGLWLFSSNTIAQSGYVYLDTGQPLEVRINDLISRLTLEEKVSLMMNSNKKIPHLNIPEYDWWNEALHGVARAGVATVFPQAIGMAATFEPELIKKVATAVSDEGRALYHESVKKNIRLRYSGLTFWTPTINIFRDPRWGRGMETYGEDPYLTSQMGVAYVKGLQGDNPKYLKTAACAKHFAVHSGPEKLRHEFNAVVSKKDLYETYLPAFKNLVYAGVESVMCAYNRTNGDPCCGHNYLLTEVLRGKWGFKGHVVTDCWALVDFYEGHKVTSNAVDAAVLALRSGVNLNCGSVFDPNLLTAVKQGLITEKEVDVALHKLMETRFKLGLFDPDELNPYASIPKSVVNSVGHRALARTVAQKSVVLLKNNGVLPLKKDLPRYYVTGPNASSIHALIGNYYGINDQFVTILEGIAGKVEFGSQIQYKPGTLLNRPNDNPIDWNSGDAKVSDATIVVLGITGMLEGEEGESIASPHFGDRLDYGIPSNQIEYLRKLKNNNPKPVVAVITGGSPMDLQEVHKLADAVLMVWYPGQEGGNAVADILFGDVSPSGRLPITFPMSIDQLPAYEDYSMQGRTYRYMDKTPMYPFGYGLSYTTFNYSDIKISKSSIRRNESAQVEVKITNSGKLPAEEVVQFYITPPVSKISQPKFSLRGIKRIKLNAGESAIVKFSITPATLELVDINGNSFVDTGKYTLHIAPAAPVERSINLGLQTPLSAVLNVKK